MYIQVIEEADVEDEEAAAEAEVGDEVSFKPSGFVIEKHLTPFFLSCPRWIW